MSLTSEVLGVLQGRTVAEINFRFPLRGSDSRHIAITPMAFNLVALAISGGRITVQPSFPPPGPDAWSVAPNRSAWYNYVAGTNTLEIPDDAQYGGNWIDGGKIVHECLHAFYDITRFGIDANAEEASAYVCEEMYYGLNPFTVPRKNGPISVIARRVAHDLCKRDLQQTIENQNVARVFHRPVERGDILEVDEDDWYALRASIGTDPSYAKSPANAVRGIIRGEEFPHDLSLSGAVEPD